MRAVKSIVFACFFIIFIAIANIIHKNITSYEAVSITSPFTYYNIIGFRNNNIKSLASLSFKNSFESLSEMFDIEVSSVANNILRKNIKIREDEAELIVFTDNDFISQITINSSDNAEVFCENILDILSSNNIQLDKQLLDDDEGSILAEIYTYKGYDYKIIIINSFTEDSHNLSIDYVNLYK